MKPRAGDDHRLCLPADLVLRLGREVLHADLYLFADRVGVQLYERLEQVRRSLLVVPGIGFDRLEEPPVCLVGSVAGEDIENEALLDRLSHGIEVKRDEPSVLVLDPEKLQGFGLGSGGERKGRQVGQPSSALHLGEYGLLELFLRSLRFGFLLLGFFERPGGENRLEAPGAFAGLG